MYYRNFYNFLLSHYYCYFSFIFICISEEQCNFLKILTVTENQN